MNITPIAWARKWFADGEIPAKEKNENGRMAWPKRFLLKELTPNRVLPTDVALYSQDVVDQLQAELAKADNMLKVRAEQNEEFGQLIEKQQAELARLQQAFDAHTDCLNAALKERDDLRTENEALACGLTGKHAMVGATYNHMSNRNIEQQQYIERLKSWGDGVREHWLQESARVQLGRKLLSQCLASLNPRNRLATTIREFLIEEPPLLCEDEGCPHHGVKHVCMPAQPGEPSKR